MSWCIKNIWGDDKTNTLGKGIGIITLDQPRERLLKVGVNALSNEELLAIILRTGYKNINVKELARTILKDLKDISELKDKTLFSLKKIKGIGEVKAIEIKASIELGRRVYKEKEDLPKEKMNDPKLIYNKFHFLIKDKKQEFFYCLYLDSKYNLIDKKLLFIGTLNKSLVHPRDVFREAYLLSSAYIICLHNHPSGDITPSMDDLELTKQLVTIGNIQGIYVIDHIIIGYNKYYSFYENGFIKRWSYD